MMKRMILAAAAAVAFLALAAPVPTQAAMVNPGLNSVAPATVMDVQYRRYDRDRRGWRSHRDYRRSRHCWNERVRVRVPGGHFVIRTHRRCGWRSW